MDARHVSALRDSYFKESTRPDGRKSTLAEYVRFITDNNLEFVTSKDMVFTDDSNEIVHCVCLNEDMVSQADFPVKIISAPYGDIHAIEAIMSRDNFKKFLDDGFLSTLMKSSQKEFMIKWIDSMNIQAQQPSKATPFYTQKPTITSKSSAIKPREDDIIQPIAPASLASRSVSLTTFKAPAGKETTINNVVYIGTITDGTNTNAVEAEGEGTVLNITGGSYDSGYGASNIAVYAKDGAVINISDGVFTSHHDSSGYGNSCIEANGATVNISGGYFECTASYADKYWVLNKKDNSNAVIKVTGGTFVNFDPSNGNTENPNESFVAEGYHVVVDGNKYTVVPD